MRILINVFMGALALAASAQTAPPSAEQMIEQLKPALTRSMRNLTIEAAPAANQATPATTSGVAANTPSKAAAADTARPAISLNVQFKFDSATILPESRKVLLTLAQALKSPELVASRFSVEGHTDAKGAADYNLRLSEQRAQAVKAFLAQQGIETSRLSASGKGASQLADTAHPHAAENRRVRIVNLD